MECNPTDYTPRAGDLARDADNDVWFIYADHPIREDSR